MNGYPCCVCGELIATTKAFERRDCPHCHAPAEKTWQFVPLERFRELTGWKPGDEN